MRRFFIKHDEEGSIVVEFALLAPVFLLMMLATIELSLVMFASTMMESAVRDASRFGITGFPQEGEAEMSREEIMEQIVRGNTDKLLDQDKLEFETLIYGQFDEIHEPEPFIDADGNGAYDEGETFSDINGNGVWDEDMGRAGLGGAGDIVIYRISYPWKIFTPMMARFLGDENGEISLSASIAVRNEPFEFGASE